MRIKLVHVVSAKSPACSLEYLQLDSTRPDAALQTLRLDGSYQATLNSRQMTNLFECEEPPVFKCIPLIMFQTIGQFSQLQFGALSPNGTIKSECVSSIIWDKASVEDLQHCASLKET